jgi:hypothetical protein
MPAPSPLSQEELLQWIQYYEEGNELEDDIMVRVLHMAHLFTKTKLPVINTATQMLAAFNDPHTSTAQVARWANQLEDELIVGGFIQPPKETT